MWQNSWWHEHLNGTQFHVLTLCLQSLRGWWQWQAWYQAGWWAARQWSTAFHHNHITAAATDRPNASSLPCWINTLVMYYLLCGSERMWMISFASSSSKDSGRHAWNKNSQKHARCSTTQHGISGVFFLLSSSEYILPPDQHVSLPGNGFYLLLCHLKSQNHGFISKVKRLENYLFGSLATMFLLSDA